MRCAAWARMTLDLKRQVIARFPLGGFLAVDGIVVHACPTPGSPG